MLASRRIFKRFFNLFSFDLTITIVTLGILDSTPSLLDISGNSTAWNRKAELEMIHGTKICRIEVNCWPSHCSPTQADTDNLRVLWVGKTVCLGK